MPVDPDRYRAAETVLARELAEILTQFDAVAAVDEDNEVRRWYVRMHGTDRDFITVWLTLGERMLHHETFFMPAPVEKQEELWRYLLRLNRRLAEVRFTLGPDDDVYLEGALPLAGVDAESVDRLIGTVYATVEQYFAAAMRIGHASKFA